MGRKNEQFIDQEFISMFDDESIAFDKDDLPYLKDEDSDDEFDGEFDDEFWDEEVESLEDLREEYYEPEFEY